MRGGSWGIRRMGPILRGTWVGNITRLPGTVEFRLANLSHSEEAVLRGYLGTLLVLERAIPGAGASIDTQSGCGLGAEPGGAG